MKLLKQLAKGAVAGIVFVAIVALYYSAERFNQRLVVQESQKKVVKIALVFTEGGKAHRFIETGSFISPDGSILTCAHLFGRTGKVYVKTVSGQTYLAEIVRVDHKVDLAVIKIAVPRPVPYFVIGPDLYVGQRVMAMGMPLDVPWTVSFGYVENLSGPEGCLIQGAPINPGNSGGPLVDTYGRLVGVNVAILLVNPFQFGEGMGMTVNLDTIRDFVRV